MEDGKSTDGSSVSSKPEMNFRTLEEMKILTGNKVCVRIVKKGAA